MQDAYLSNQCDEAKPECQRCTDLGFECNGYRSAGDVVFRDQTDHYARVAQGYRASDSPPAFTSHTANSKLTRMRHYTFDLSLCSEIDNSLQNETSMFREFLHLYLPPNQTDETITQFSYLELLPVVQEKCPVLRAAMAAISAVGLGTVRADPKLLGNSRHLYSDALQRVSLALSKTTGDYKDNEKILAAAKTLGFCEIFVATNSNQDGWIAHEEGVRSIFENMRSITEPSKLSKLLFYSNRFHLMNLGLLTRKTVVYDEFVWQRQTSIDSGDEFVSLSNILVQIPRALERADSVFAVESVEERRQRLENTLRQLTGLQQQLKQWYQLYSKIQYDQLYTITTFDHFPTASTMLTAQSFPALFKFNDFRCALIMMSYWHGIGQLNWSAGELLKMTNSIEGMSLFPDGMDMTNDAVQCAIRICQGMPYFWEQQHCGIFGRITAAWPLSFSRRVFTAVGDLPALLWCSEFDDWLSACGICMPYHGLPDTVDICPERLSPNSLSPLE